MKSPANSLIFFLGWHLFFFYSFHIYIYILRALICHFGKITASQMFHLHNGEFDDKNLQIHGRSLHAIVLFILTVILFFALIYFCIRWACQSYSDRQNNTTSLLSMSGLDANTIKNLPIESHQARSSTDESQCSICLANLVNGEKVKVLPSCKHAFHPDCVDLWLSSQSSCPLCRASLGEDHEELSN